MTLLLDVNLLLAAIWESHPLHEQAFSGIEGHSVAVCPLAELGFLRISTHPKVNINVPMAEARLALKTFLDERKAQRVPCDLPALDSAPKKSDEVTDHYLADLAARHQMKLLTLDANIKHPAVIVAGKVT
jgi:predicted nucleic acid-binding protein